MTITALKEQIKNPDRVSIFVDGAYSFSLTLGQVIDEKIKIGVVLEPARVEELKKLSDEGKLYAKTLDWLSRRLHSTKELQGYLRRKKTEPELAELIEQKLLAKGYLDDMRFADWWVQQRRAKQHSARAITVELRQKGIDNATIQQVLTATAESASDTNGPASDSDALQLLIQKLMTKSRYHDPARLIRYLMGKGFRYGDIKDALQAEQESANLQLPEEAP